MFGRYVYILLIQLLNPKIRYMGDYKSLLAADALRDIYALAIHSIKVSRKRQEHKFPTYGIPELYVEDKALVEIMLGMCRIPNMMLLIM